MSDELVAALVSGVLGLVVGVATTWFSARKQRQAERENFRRELANTFLTKLGGAADATRNALEVQERGDPAEVIQDRLERAQWLLGELAAQLPAVRVRLGRDSGIAARHAVEELQRTAERLGARPASPETLKEAREAFDRARDADDRLVAALSNGS